MSLSHVLPGGFPSDQEPPRRRGSARRQRRQKRQRRRRTLSVLLVTVLVGAVAVAGAYLGLAPVVRQFTQPKDYKGTGTGHVTVKIPNGSPGRAIAKILNDDGVVKTQVAFLDAAKKDPRSGSIQPGSYDLHQHMSGASALALLLNPASKLTRVVTIPEGSRAAAVYAAIARATGVSASQLKSAATSGDIGLPAAARNRPEGFLYPATYEFQPDETPAQMLGDMVKRGSEEYASLGIPAAQLRDVVIKASIVEAEAGNKKYMGKVARVLDNRLSGHIKLQLDSTVSYATGKFGVTTTSADRQVNSGYNTYRYYGLPAGPIDSPGEDALKAALHPTAGGWFFFVTVNPLTGETKFAETATEHEVYVREFQKWLQQHPQH